MYSRLDILRKEINESDIINIDEFQSRAAIIEDGKVVEILIEREEEGRINGSIYKGKVANVLPGMESAFVNIGLEKNGFLYVNDLREFEEKYLDGILNSSRPIEDILNVGDDVVVQILNEPRGTKGAELLHILQYQENIWCLCLIMII